MPYLAKVNTTNL